MACKIEGHHFNHYTAIGDCSRYRIATGHSTPGMFLRYNTVDEEDGKDAIAKLERFWKSTQEEKSTLCAPGPQERKNRGWEKPLCY
ncbi:MAG: hypothetical protein JRI41_08265 [Deltaproteobacteria bacterium]|nr:hypothetical protein [Deltaproteobacteria bacterium]